LQLADPRRGRFRTFLLHTLEHFVVSEWRRSHSARHGGGAVSLPLDLSSGEQRYALEPATTMTPQSAYERQWALTLLDQVLVALREQYTRAGKERLFQEIAGFLWGKDPSPLLDAYAVASARLGMTPGAVRVAVHRLRERCSQLLRAAVAQTVASPEEVEEELKYLVRVVGG
jgi:DNA-directed RNA polymerase specialized sigma24 family protein